MWRELALLVGLLVGVTAVALVLGAPNLAYAMSFGAIAMVLAVVLLIARGD